MAAAKNLRGVALMRIGEYGLAEKALQKARELDPELWEARFNLAEIPFLRKSWPEARRRFEALAERKANELEGATGDLIQFKILLTYLLEGKEKKADRDPGSIANIVDEPGLLLRQSCAGVSAQRRKRKRMAALKAAEKSFSPSLYKLFVESFYEVGWMEKPEGAVPVRARSCFAGGSGGRGPGEFCQSGAGLSDSGITRARCSCSIKWMRRRRTRPSRLICEGKICWRREKTKQRRRLCERRLRPIRSFWRRALTWRESLSRSATMIRRPQTARSTSRSHLRRQAATTVGTTDPLSDFPHLLLEGRDGPAQKALDEFKMMDETPALYYGQAAWAFQHGNSALGNTWLASNARILIQRIRDAPLPNLSRISAGRAPRARRPSQR